MKTFVTLFIFTTAFLQAQTNTVSIRLDSLHGQHACVDSYWPTLNLTPDPDFGGVAWTEGGTPYTARGFIKFYLSFIDSNSTVISAYLSLYGNPNPLHGPGHSTLNGSNASYIRKVVSPWDQYIVTWSTQPSTGILNQVTLPQSTSQQEDYLDIDVTNLVKDMVNHPSSNYGFSIGLLTEIHYRSLDFASSHCPDTTKRPKLVITYTTLTGVQQISSQVPNKFSVSQNFPNPFNPSTKIKFDVPASLFISEGQKVTLSVYDISGRKIAALVDQSMHPGSYEVTWDASNFSTGAYFYKLTAGDFSETKKMILMK